MYRESNAKAMITVAGFNLYQQWYPGDSKISPFESITCKSAYDFNYNEARLIQICWSYNIVEKENSFYKVGFINAVDRARKIKLPEECSFPNAKIAGNDDVFLVADKSQIWILNLENDEVLKCLNLNIESSEQSETKKRRLEDKIDKIKCNNDRIIYLTELGNVYCDILPNHIDTTHCLGKVIDIQCGYDHFMLLTDMGRVYTWGSGRRLQLGHGDITEEEKPKEVEALAGIKIIKISSGGWHCLALSESGDLYAWGWNDKGQLGITNTEEKSYALPTLVDIYDKDTLINKNVKDMACGSKFSVILLQDNSVWTSGTNNYCQLGFPKEVNTIPNFTKAYQCSSNSRLMGGYWTSAIISD